MLKYDESNRDVIQKLETEKKELLSDMTQEEKRDLDCPKAKKLIEINKKILSAYLDKSNDTEKETTEILQKLIDNNFDFGILTNHEKTTLAQKSTIQKLNESNLFAELK